MNVEAVFLVTSNSRFVTAFQLEADTIGIAIEQVNELEFINRCNKFTDCN